MMQEPGTNSQIPSDVSLQPLSRRPTVLPANTVSAAMRLVPPFNSRTPLAESNASIILVTFNSEVFTRLCLASVIANTDLTGSEIIVVDNGSTDGTVGFLQATAAQHPQAQLILNPTNRGFAGANNQGLALATGRVLVLLNNDTLVAPGWLDRLQQHLRDDKVGLVGPVTNRSPNESKIETGYDTYGEFLEFAKERLRSFSGQSFDIPMLLMLAVAMRREVFNAIGPLDENFGLGMFEDDDYSLRVQAAGYRVVCATDVFVHHFGQASFGTLIASGEFNRIFERNRQYFQEKWKRAWNPHKPLETDDYRGMVQSIAGCVEEFAAVGQIVSVITNGDPAFLRSLHNHGRTGWHFPRQPDGEPLAHHPTDGRHALSLLNHDCAAGAAFLVIPQPYLWCLDFYAELSGALQHCRRIDPPDGCCAIFDLSTLPAETVQE